MLILFGFFQITVPRKQFFPVSASGLTGGLNSVGTRTVLPSCSQAASFALLPSVCSSLARAKKGLAVDTVTWTRALSVTTDGSDGVMEVV